MKYFIKKILNLVFIILRYFKIRNLLFKIEVIFNQIYSIWNGILFNPNVDNIYIKFPASIKGYDFMKIGNNFVSESGLRLHAYSSFLDQKFIPNIIIGENVSIERDCHISGINSIKIGNNVLIGSRVYISDHSHGNNGCSSTINPPARRPLYSKGKVIINDNVWIGEGAVILPGVEIGVNSIIGANAVVTKSIPANCVAAGVPAIVIRHI